MFFILLLKGFIIGIAFIIPGVSGGTLAIYLGIYDKLLHSISHLFSEFKKSIMFLIPVLMGIIVSIVLLAKLLGWLLDINSFVTLLFFVGLLLGGIPSLHTKIKGQKINLSHIFSFILSFSFVILLLISNLTNNQSETGYFNFTLSVYLLIFLLGLAASATMVVPGVSGSALLITLGFYTAIVTNVIGNIFDFSAIGYNLQVVIPFGLGALVGIFFISRLIEIALRKYASQTYLAIIGFILASVIVMIFEIKDSSTAVSFTDQTPIYLNFGLFIANNLLTFVLGLMTLSLGVFTALKLVGIDRLFSHDKHQKS
jgi:putative membrane protein